MKLYKIMQHENNGHDTYDSAVVIAESMEEACNMHPDVVDYDDPTRDPWKSWPHCWASSPKHVTVLYLGEADIGLKKGFVLKSFNAG